MKKLLLKINKGILFACVSMYFGTGWSLVFFSLPSTEILTPENYYQQFVPPIERATDFFTYMTIIMMISAIIIIVEEWKSYRKWYPIGILAAVIAASILTSYFIFPYNEQLAAGITSQAQLDSILDIWQDLHMLRMFFWSAEWLLMLLYLFSLLPGNTNANK
ncbi:MAG: hypothetical protein U5K69_03420 [Balneolaceae bacterium]|nr:hypothetical protein [Balneolaceae bacterium]